MISVLNRFLPQSGFALPVSLIQNGAPQREQIGIQGYFVNLHEYRSKHLLDRYGIPIPEGQAASTLQ
jgi:hypothetical protein